MILVTGGTGLVGSYLLYELACGGYQIRALRRKKSNLDIPRNVFSFFSNNAEALFSKIEWFEADMLDIASLEDAMNGVKDVYHCAGVVSFNPSDSKKIMQINTNGTANLVNTSIAEKIRKFCFVSSVAAIGKMQKGMVITENTWWKPGKKLSSYAVSKYNSEREVWRGIEEGLEAIIVNPGVIIGAADPDKSSARLIKSGYRTSLFYTKGITGFVGAKDVARAMIALMEANIKNERFILVSENLSYRELFELIALYFNKPAPVIRIPVAALALFWRLEMLRTWITGGEPVITKHTARSARAMHLFSNQKLKERLNFEFTPMAETIKEACEMYLAIIQNRI